MKNSINFFLISFLVSNSFSLVLRSAIEEEPGSNRNLYRNVEVYNGTKNNITVSYEVTSIYSKEPIIKKENKSLKMGEVEDFTRLKLDQVAGADLKITISAQGSKPIRLIFTNFPNDRNFFLDVVLADNNFSVRPYSVRQIIGYKKSRKGKYLINNVKQQDIDAALQLGTIK